jgi:hypothetical protein
VQARQQIANGKKLKQSRPRGNEDAAFGACAARLIESLRPSWRSPLHAHRGRIERVLDAAEARGLIASRYENLARWRWPPRSALELAMLPVPGSGTGDGRLVVKTIARIRREFFVKGRSIKEIVHDLKVSRKTVRKVLRSGETSFSYEREVQPLPRLGRWRPDLDRLPRARRLTLIRIFEELRGLGYERGYDAVRRYARSWRKARVGASVDAFVPLTFEPLAHAVRARLSKRDAGDGVRCP